MKNTFMEKLLKPILFLAILTVVCGFLARSLTNSETLSDYAEKKAEAAQNNTYDEKEAHIDETKENEIGEDTAMKPSESPQTPSSQGNGTTQHDTALQTAQQQNDDPIQNDTSQSPLENPSDTTADSPSPMAVVYQEGFYYEELTDEVKVKITGISYPVAAAEAATLAIPAINTLEDNTIPAVSYDDLRYLSVLYYDFNGTVQTGELICNKGIAQDLVEIFYELYQNEYQIEKIRLIDEYQGDDTASMADNNTSCFNYRVVDGTSSLSKHALGCAIDINPFYNPYVVFNRNGSGETYISPAGSEVYADRSKDFPYKIDENDLCYRLFKEHGFVWGGDWNSCKDYQHFQKVVD